LPTLITMMDYLTATESTVVVNLPRFIYGAGTIADHVAYHLGVIDGVVEAHATFSVSCDASTFSVWHTAAAPMFVRLAREARARYKDKLSSVLVVDAPLSLRCFYKGVIAPFLPSATSAKVVFKTTARCKAL